MTNINITDLRLNSPCWHLSTDMYSYLTCVERKIFAIRQGLNTCIFQSMKACGGVTLIESTHRPFAQSVHMVLNKLCWDAS